MFDHPSDSADSCDESMTRHPEPCGSFWEYLRDVGLAFLMIIGGFLLAAGLAVPFRNVTDLAYPVALVVGMAPLWWFTRYRQIHNRDWYDYALLGVVFVILVALRAAFPGINGWHMAIACAAIGALHGWWDAMRRKLFCQSDKDDLAV